MHECIYLINSIKLLFNSKMIVMQLCKSGPEFYVLDEISELPSVAITSLQESAINRILLQLL